MALINCLAESVYGQDGHNAVLWLSWRAAANNLKQDNNALKAFIIAFKILWKLGIPPCIGTIHLILNALSIPLSFLILGIVRNI